MELSPRIGVPTIDEEADKLWAYISSLPDFKFVRAVGWGHIGATIVDGVIQSGLNWDHVVKPRVDRILQRKDAERTSGFLRLLAREGVVNLVDLNHPKRLAIVEVTMLLYREGIETEDELKGWLRKESNLEKLDDISWIGEKTLDYFKELAGLQAVAIDVHLKNFLKRAGVDPGDYAHAQAVYEAAAREHGKRRSDLDQSVWHFMHDKKRKEPIGC